MLAICTFAPVALLAGEHEESGGGKDEKAVVASIRPPRGLKSTELPELAKISFEQALKAALAASPGSVIKAELEVEDGNLMYSFDVVNSKHEVIEVEIDAGNGRVLDVDKD